MRHTDHDPSPNRPSYHGSCCYPARGDCPARMSHYKFLVTIIIGQCIITSTSPQCSLFYMPAVLFVLLKHRQQPLRRAPTTAGRRAPAPPAPEQGAPSICAPIPDAHDLVVRIIHSIVFPHPITVLCPRFRSVVTRLVSINQATRCLSLFCWAPTSGV